MKGVLRAVPGLVLAAWLALTAAAPAPPRGDRVDGAAALRHVERLVALGPRPSGSPEIERSREYVLGELRRAGIATRVERFEALTPVGPVAMANLVAVIPGQRPDVILIAGHYDTKWFRDVRFVGANDGGSSTALLIELARSLALRRRAFTYRVAFFDGEEARVEWTPTDSLYGSRFMAAELQRTGRLPRAMILVDMVGDRDLQIRRELASTPWLTEALWVSARRLGYGRHFLPEALGVEDDHAPFLRLGVPAALLIDFDYPPWHTAGDTLERVSARSLQIVGDVVLGALPAVERRLALETR